MKSTIFQHYEKKKKKIALKLTESSPVLSPSSSSRTHNSSGQSAFKSSVEGNNSVSQGGDVARPTAAGLNAVTISLI